MRNFLFIPSITVNKLLPSNLHQNNSYILQQKQYLALEEKRNSRLYYPWRCPVRVTDALTLWYPVAIKPLRFHM